jgi:hypothetical protein
MDDGINLGFSEFRFMSNGSAFPIKSLRSFEILLTRPRGTFSKSLLSCVSKFSSPRTVPAGWRRK